MTQRRSLVEGLTPAIDPEAAVKFIYGENEAAKEAPKRIDATPAEVIEKPVEASSPAVKMPSPMPASTATKSARTHFTTRLRTDLAEALKRASLERQLAGQTPNTVQDLLEAALAPWLREQGYL